MAASGEYLSGGGKRCGEILEDGSSQVKGFLQVEPFTHFGANAAEKFFSEDEQEELLTLIKRLAA